MLTFNHSLLDFTRESAALIVTNQLKTTYVHCDIRQTSRRWMIRGFRPLVVCWVLVPLPSVMIPQWSSILPRFGRSQATHQQAIDAFRVRAEELQSAFHQQQSASGKPRGLLWKACDFEGDAKFAEEDGKGLTAWWGVTISFEAIPGGPMEGVEAVSNLRAATAEFSQNGGAWSPVRVHFNLEPIEAIRFARDNAERKLSEVNSGP